MTIVIRRVMATQMTMMMNCRRQLRICREAETGGNLVSRLV